MGASALVRRVTGVELGCDGYGFDLVFGPAPDAAAAHIATRYNGLYMIYNVAAAFFAARELGVDAAHLQPTLDALRPRRRTHGPLEHCQPHRRGKPGEESRGLRSSDSVH